MTGNALNIAHMYVAIAEYTSQVEQNHFWKLDICFRRTTNKVNTADQAKLFTS